MLSTKALKGFIVAFLLIVVGGLVFIGSSPQSFNNDLPNAFAGTLALIGLALMLLGLLISFIACAA